MFKAQFTYIYTFSLPIKSNYGQGGEVSTRLGMLEITSLSSSRKPSRVGTFLPSHVMMEIDPFFQNDVCKKAHDDVERIIVMFIVRNL